MANYEFGAGSPEVVLDSARPGCSSEACLMEACPSAQARSFPAVRSPVPPVNVSSGHERLTLSSCTSNSSQWFGALAAHSWLTVQSMLAWQVCFTLLALTVGVETSAQGEVHLACWLQPSISGGLFRGTPLFSRTALLLDGVVMV